MDGQVPQYQVVGTEDDNTYSPTAGLVRTKRITVRMADGTTTYVEVPLTDYTPDTVQAAVEAMVAAHEGVMGLQGPMVPAPQRRARGT